MGKRVDHDATQEVSSSQLVPDVRPPAFPGASKNDASMWMQAPVSVDDFVGAAKKKSAQRGSRAIVVGVLAAMVVAGLGAGIWYAFLRESPAPTAASTAMPSAAGAAAGAPLARALPAATQPADAAVAAITPDAAVAVDAGAPEVAIVQADAISAAGKLIKKRPAKRPHKRHRVKKKTASAKKKRRR